MDDTTAAKSAHVEFRITTMNQMLESRSTTLILTALCIVMILAAAVWLAGRYFTGVSVSDGQVVLHLSDEAGRQMLPDDPYLRDLASGPDALLHDAYVAVPRWFVVIVGTAVLGFVAVIYFGIRWLCGSSTPRESH